MKYILAALISAGLIGGIVTVNVGERILKDKHDSTYLGTSGTCVGTPISSCGKVSSGETCSDYYSNSMNHCTKFCPYRNDPSIKYCCGTNYNGKGCVGSSGSCSDSVAYCTW